MFGATVLRNAGDMACFKARLWHQRFQLNYAAANANGQTKGQMKALADKITPDNWGRGAYELPDGKRCLVGHLRVHFHVYGAQRYPLDYYGAVAKLAKIVGWSVNQVPVMCDEQYLVYWNDCPSRTAREVAELCAKAGV